MSTEISKHAREAAQQFRSYLEDPDDAAVEAIAADFQRAIDAATAEKDKRVLEFGVPTRVDCVEELTSKFTASEARNAKLVEALEYVRSNGMLATHGHWDSTMRSGAGCEVCEKQRRVAQYVRETLSEIKGGTKP